MLGALALAGGAAAQMDFSSFYTQTVKTGQPWAQIETQIQSLDVKMEVNRGVVTTRATFEYTPGMGITNTYTDCAPTECQRKAADTTQKVDPIVCPAVCEMRVIRDSAALDSLETVSNFNLPLNSVITDMTLWVGETPVKAALQERALASAQYESIVKRRRDPALLESWGNGNYMLRIFPGKSGETRKLQVEFVQGIENDGDRVSTALPLILNLVKIYQPTTTQAEYDKLPYRTIGSIRVEAVSVDGKTYDLDMPGVGSGKVSGTPLKLEAKKVSELKEGKLSIATSACASCLTPWTASHKGADFFGAKATLIGKELKFGDQPVERHVIVDVASSSLDPNVVDRARKIALLSLKAYAAEPFKGTLGFSNGQGSIRYAFAKPVSMGADELAQAYAALVDWTPGKRSDAEATIAEFAKSRGASEPSCVLYLVNNDTTPYYNYGGVWNETAQIQYQKFEQELAKNDSALAATLKGAHTMLFGFWNDYHLSQVATLTGGYQVGSMYQYGFYRNAYPTGVAVDAVAPTPEESFRNLQLPPLFGPGRYDAYTIADLKVTPKSGGITNLVVNQGQYYNYGILLRGDVAMPGTMVLDKKSAGGAALAKSASMLPYGYYGGTRDTVDLRMSGNFQGSGRVTVVIEGLWGGLRFATEVELEMLATDGKDDTQGAGIWAMLKGEEIGLNYAEEDIKAIQALGKEYHIVNRQMSLLALEPGMELWTEMPSKDGQTGTRTSTEAPTTQDSMKGVSPGSTVDNVSLESILKDFVPIAKGASLRLNKVGSISQRVSGGQLELSWSLEGAQGEATFRIVQMSGREVARLQGVRGEKGFTASMALPSLRGTYWVIAKSGKHTRIQALQLLGNGSASR
jgi:Vault protein inter-alpha-trypsin domain